MGRRAVKSKGGKTKTKTSSITSKASAASSTTQTAQTAPSDGTPDTGKPYERLSFAPSPTNELAKGILNFIGSTLRIQLTDGRIIIGDMVCLDNYRNVILSNTYQAHIPTIAGAAGNTSTKHMGLILVPGKAIVKIEQGKAVPSEGQSEAKSESQPAS